MAAAVTPTIPGNFAVRACRGAGDSARPDARRDDITYQPVHTHTRTHRMRATVIGRRAIAICRPSVVAAGELAVSFLSLALCLAGLQAATAVPVRSSAKLYDHAKF